GHFLLGAFGGCRVAFIGVVVENVFLAVGSLFVTLDYDQMPAIGQSCYFAISPYRLHHRMALIDHALYFFPRAVVVALRLEAMLPGEVNNVVYRGADGTINTPDFTIDIGPRNVDTEIFQDHRKTGSAARLSVSLIVIGHAVDVGNMGDLVRSGDSI